MFVRRNSILKTASSYDSFSSVSSKKKKTATFSGVSSLHTFSREEISEVRTPAQVAPKFAPQTVSKPVSSTERVRTIAVLFFIMIAAIAYIVAVSAINHRISVVSMFVGVPVFVFCLSAAIFLIKESGKREAI